MKRTGSSGSYLVAVALRGAWAAGLLILPASASAGSATSNGSTLVYRTTVPADPGQDNNVRIDPHPSIPGVYRVRDNEFIIAGGSCVQAPDPNPLAWADCPATLIVVVTKEGDDMVDIDSTITLPTRISTGTGLDVVQGGGGPDVVKSGRDEDTVNGGAGDDRLVGGSEDDILNGEAGDDRVIGGAGLDDITGGPGIDVMRGSGDDDTFHAMDAEIDRPISCGSGFDDVSDVDPADPLTASCP